jgi:hypothetical protein
MYLRNVKPKNHPEARHRAEGHLTERQREIRQNRITAAIGVIGLGAATVVGANFVDRLQHADDPLRADCSVVAEQGFTVAGLAQDISEQLQVEGRNVPDPRDTETNIGRANEGKWADPTHIQIGDTVNVPGLDICSTLDDLERTGEQSLTFTGLAWNA